MKKKKSIERRIDDLEHSRGINIPVVVRLDADDPYKDAKIAAAKEKHPDRGLLVVVRRVIPGGVKFDKESGTWIDV